MFTIIKPPHIVPPSDQFTVFLAGSIEMGVAEPWQVRLEEMLRDLDVLILNPRREEWDNSWEQKRENDEFRGQVEWEMNGMDRADLIVLFLDPNTKSPISLLELGLHATSGTLMVCCEEGFWRKGNVEIVCARYNIPFYQNRDEFMSAIRDRIMSH